MPDTSCDSDCFVKANVHFYQHCRQAWSCCADSTRAGLSLSENYTVEPLNGA